MNNIEQVDNFRNCLEIELEAIALSLKTNPSDTNTFILKFNNSIYELLNSTFLLLDEQFIESGGSVISTLWERNLTLEYIYIDFETRKSKFQEYNKLKKSPWKIFQMVKDITDLENHPNLSKNIKYNIYYMQYTFLCAIKHGNPYTFNYLNREENHSVIGLKNIDESTDNDLVTYLKIIALNIVLEFISNYYSFIKDNIKIISFNKLNLVFSNFTRNLELNVPRIINPDKSEFDEETWDYFDNL